MAPRKGAKRKGKGPTPEEIEADRVAATSGLHGAADGNHGTEEVEHPTHEEAVQGANLASGTGGGVDENAGIEYDAPLPADPEASDVDPVNERALEEANDTATEDAQIEQAIEGGDATEGDPEEKPSNSVVKDKFKTKYIENARALGVGGKAAKRSNWDWLAQQIAAYCLDDKQKINIGLFTAILDANGVDHSKWTNRNKGWEGRFRMTGRVALQKVVANAGHLILPALAPAEGGEPMEAQTVNAPSEWCALYRTKTAAA